MSEAAKKAAVPAAAAPGMSVPPRDELAHRLWQLWRFGQRPEVDAFLRQHQASNSRQLLAVLAIDQAERWNSHERRLVEAYLKNFDQLRNDADTFELVLNEIAFRKQLGEAVNLDAYRNRFPQFLEQINKLSSQPGAGTESEIDLTSTVAQNDGACEERQTLRLAPEVVAAAPSDDDSAVMRFFQGASVVLDDATKSKTALPQIKSIGPYEIERVLARGGMGIIYQALDTRLKRPAALKMILTGAHSDPESFARFRAEAEAVARLQHPSIVQIFEVGEHDGLPFLALEYIDGQNLAQKLQGKPMPPREAAQLMLALALAIEFAHQRGIIHRDLKPANILITASGQAKITDFGLAKLRESCETATRPGEVLGTPNYMAPEQAEGHPSLIGPVVDVYSLGALLYELLTGQPPFQGGSPMETLLRVRMHEPIPPTHYEPKLPRNLVTVCMRCLRKERHHRYASAAALAADLQRFLDGKPVHARPVTYAERIWMWASRHPALACVTAVSASLLLAANLLIVWQWREAESAKAAAQDRAMILLRTQENLSSERLRLRSVDNERERVEHQQRLRVAELEFLTMDAENAVRVLDQCPLDHRGFVWHYLRRQFEGSVFTIQPEGVLLTMSITVDGRQLVAFRNDGELQARSIANGEVLHRKQLPRPENCPTGGFSQAVFSRDRSHLAAVCQPNSGETTPQVVVVWNVNKGEVVGSLPCRAGTAIRLALSADGRRIAWCEGNFNQSRRLFERGMVRVVDLPSGATIWEKQNDSLSLVNLSFSPDARKLALTGREHQLLVVDAENGKTIVDREEKDWTGNLIAWSPNGKQIALQRGHEIMLFSLDGNRIGTLNGHRGLIYQVAYSKRGDRLVTASSDHTIRVWDVADLREVQSLVGNTRTVDRVAISDDEKLVVSINAGGRCKVWDLTRGHEPLALGNDVHNDWVPSVAFHPNGHWLASGCGDRAVRLWDLKTGQQLRAFETKSPVESVAFQANGEMLAAGMDNGSVSVWHLTSNRETTLTGHLGSVLGVLFHPSQNSILSWGEDGRIRVWDPVTRQHVREFARHGCAVHSVALHPNGKIVASGDANGIVRIWRLADAQELRIVQAHDTRVSAIVFSPDGPWFATANSNRERNDAETCIRIWKTSTGELLQRLTGHKLSIWSLDVSSDGRRIASAGEDWTVRIWDTRYGDHLLTLKGHSDDVRSVKFSPDGRLLVSAGDNSFIRVWDATPLDKGPGLREQWWAVQSAANPGATSP